MKNMSSFSMEDSPSKKNDGSSEAPPVVRIFVKFDDKISDMLETKPTSLDRNFRNPLQDFNMSLTLYFRDPNYPDTLL